MSCIAPCAIYFDTEGLQAAKEASAGPDNLIDTFNHIERFFRRVEIYTGIIPTTAMTDMIVEIMVEVLTILAIATKEVKHGRFSQLVLLFTLPSRLTDYLEKYLKKLMGNREIEDSLERLDKLTQEEARMASAELLKMTHSVDGKVTGVDDRVRGVEGQIQDVHGDVREVGSKVQTVEECVQGVRSNVHDVGSKVQGVEGTVLDVWADVQDVGNNVQNVDDRVQGIDNSVRGVDDKLDQANRLLSLD